MGCGGGRQHEPMEAAVWPAVLPGPGRSAPPAARLWAAQAPAPEDPVAVNQSAAGAGGGGSLHVRRRGISICSLVHGRRAPTRRRDRVARLGESPVPGVPARRCSPDPGHWPTDTRARPGAAAVEVGRSLPGRVREDLAGGPTSSHGAAAVTLPSDVGRPNFT